MGLGRRLANLVRRERVDREIAAELRAHIEMRTEENIAAGMTPAAARRDAHLRFGNPVSTREQVTGADAALGLEKIWADLRHTLRWLRKAPVFTVAIVLTLALGIGATTAIFSAMDAVLLRTMPVPNPQQLFYLHVPDGQPYGAQNTGDSETSFSLPVFETLRQTHAFAQVMAFAPVSISKVAVRFGSGAPEMSFGEMVSGNFFSGLGVGAQAGRLLAMEDEQQNASAVVLSDAYWHTRFGGDPRAIGETLYIKGIPFTIVGVAAEGFPGAEPGTQTDWWIPLQRRAELSPWGGSTRQMYASPDWWCLRLLVRVTPGVSIQRAIAGANPAFQAAAYARLAPDRAHPRTRLTAVAAKGMQGLGDTYREPMLILMALVMLVLAIACSNVAMLIVARNASRQRDFSLRMALGAGRGVLLRQLLMESGVLVAAGAGIGWLFAVSATRVLASWFELKTSLGPDRLVLLFTAAISALAALVFGLAPMRMAAKAPVTSVLRGPALNGFERRRGGSVVLAVQVALCFTLLTAAGLLLRTLLNFEHTRLGMRAESLLVFGITPQKATTDEARFRFYHELRERLRALPGVEGATYAENRPGSGWSNNDEPIVDGVTIPFQQVPLRANTVGPDFLAVMGIPLLEGRDLRESDTAVSQRVVIVNETFQKKLLPHTNPLGHQLGDLNKDHFTIVGVAADSKYRSVDEAPRATAYFPYTQSGSAEPELEVELRTSGNPMALLPGAEKAVHAMDPSLPLEKPETEAATFAESYAQQRVFSRLATFFALLAAGLVGIGLYGTLSYRVSRRSAEIGVRMAFGARRSQVLGLVMQECFRIAGMGIAMGIPLALMAGTLMRSMLYGLEPQDATSLLEALAGLMAVSVIAGWIPARRAASIDPVQALRAE